MCYFGINEWTRDDGSNRETTGEVSETILARRIEPVKRLDKKNGCSERGGWSEGKFQQDIGEE